MRRALLVAGLVAVAAAAVVLWPGGSARHPRYTVVFDNAFGLVAGGDVRIGGVLAGQTVSFEPSRDVPPKAIVGIELTKPGFDALRADANCDVREQSLIGEYYVDCQPGSSRRVLPAGGRIPVAQTSSTIPIDLTTDIYRLPTRQRLRIVISELGTGLAGRPAALRATLHRAVPALRRTDDVLATLGHQTRTLERFVADSDRVTAGLAPAREDVAGSFAEAAREAGITGRHRTALAAEFRQLPEFLRRLRGDATHLTRLSHAEVPLMQRLGVAAPGLDELFSRLKTFAGQARPNLRTLAQLSATGRAALKTTAPDVRELGRATERLPSAAKSLRRLLQSLDTRALAVEPDRRAVDTAPPPPDKTAADPARGFTGYEALLNYLYWQTLSQNAYDGVSHVLRTTAFVNDCGDYTPKPSAELIKRCASWLGPHQPGINEPDPTRTDGPPAPARAKRRAHAKAPAAPAPVAAGPAGPPPAPAAPQAPSVPATPGLPTPAVPALPTPQLPPVPPLPGVQGLDYLLGP